MADDASSQDENMLAFHFTIIFLTWEFIAWEQQNLMTLDKVKSDSIHVWTSQIVEMFILLHTCTMSIYNVHVHDVLKQITASKNHTVKQLPLKIWSYNGSRLVLVSSTWPPLHPLLLLRAVQLYWHYLALHQIQHQTFHQQNWDWLEEVSLGVLELSWEFRCHLCCLVTGICWEYLCS